MLLPISMPEAIVLASLIVSVALVASCWVWSRRAPAPFQSGYPFPQLPPLPAEAYPVDASGVWVGPDTRLGVGSAVLCRDAGSWWRAEVIALEGDERVRIHFVGWEPMWDRSVSRGELQ